MKYSSKKGFTLIESITYLSISMIVTLLAIHLLIDVSKIYYLTLKENMKMNMIDESIHLIDVVKNDEFDKVYVNGDRIVFKTYKNRGQWEEKCITRKEDNLVVEYYDFINKMKPSATNVILQNISDFKIVEKGKLIYLSVEVKGNKFIVCI